MTRKFISFEDVEGLATIDQLAEMLGLNPKKERTQLRCSCPIHGGERSLAISPDVRSKRGSLGVFFCQEAKTGGDRIGLVAHCMDIGQQDAAFFITEQFGIGTVETSTVNSTVTVSNSCATVPQKTEGGRQPAPFDPAAFAQKLAFNEEVAALADEHAAQAFRIGMHRGHLYVPAVYPSGAIAGWWKLADGKLVPPAKWLPDTSNIVQLKRA
jgi:hypothetical protein